MQTFWLVRHAHRLDFIEPEWFESAIYPYDPPLSSVGSDRAIAIAQELSHVEIDTIFTSPFLRTIQTAAPLARRLQLPIWLEWGLCEWLCKEWTSELPQATPIDELKMNYPNLNFVDRSLVVPCYPETLEELDARIQIIADKLVQNNDRNILAIAHKGSVLGIVAALTGEHRWLTYDLACGQIIKLLRTGDGDRWIVGSW